MPHEYFDWDIAFDTGWQLDYINSLSMSQIHEYIQIKDARNKARVK
jgi:hypothetical protein